MCRDLSLGFRTKVLAKNLSYLMQSTIRQFALNIVEVNIYAELKIAI